MSLPIQLQPEAQGLLDLIPKNMPDMSKLPLNTLRAGLNEEGKDAFGIIGAATKIFDESVDEETVTAPGGVSLLITRPKGTPKDQILPVILYIHGGGWTMGDAKLYENTREYYTTRAKAAVVFVNYSLSPEVKYPVALHECYDALSWIVDTDSAIHHLDANKIAVVGDSAGGNLAAALAIFDKQKRGVDTKLKCQVLLYPVINAYFDNDSYNQFEKGYLLTRESMKYFWYNYTTKEDRLISTVAPLKASIDELKDIAPAFVATAEADVLRDEGEEYARKLMEAQVPVVAIRALGCIHGFVATGEKSGRAVLSLTVSYIQEHWDL